jgi:hypothetical protein
MNIERLSASSVEGLGWAALRKLPRHCLDQMCDVLSDTVSSAANVVEDNASCDALKIFSTLLQVDMHERVGKRVSGRDLCNLRC